MLLCNIECTCCPELPCFPVSKDVVRGSRYLRAIAPRGQSGQCPNSVLGQSAVAGLRQAATLFTGIRRSVRGERLSRLYSPPPAPRSREAWLAGTSVRLANASRRVHNASGTSIPWVTEWTARRSSSASSMSMRHDAPCLIHRCRPGPSITIRTASRRSPPLCSAPSADAVHRQRSPFDATSSPYRAWPSCHCTRAQCPGTGRCDNAPATKIPPSTPVSRTSARAARALARETAKSSASLATDTAG